MDKTVILAVPYLYGLDRCIEKNLNLLGFKVINLCFDNRDSHYPNLFSRLKALYHKKITRDGDYKKQLQFARYQAQTEAAFAALGGRKADYALCIRANIYPKHLIRRIREHSEICVNYQWDAVADFPDILQYAALFDRFFVFDPQDAVKYPQYGFKTAANFCFDFLPPASGSGEGLYFLGGYDAGRQDTVLRFLDAAQAAGLQPDFHIYCSSEKAAQSFAGRRGVHCLDRSGVLDFEDNLHKVRDCRAVVDFAREAGRGLSFRAFEALYFKKKLITDNSSIRRYDFYHPANIYIAENGRFDGIAEFLAAPYHDLPDSVRQKYTFSNWLRYILNIEPHQPLNLPPA